jgi:hypothetical protein
VASARDNSNWTASTVIGEKSSSDKLASRTIFGVGDVFERFLLADALRVTAGKSRNGYRETLVAAFKNDLILHVRLGFLQL